MHLPRLHVERRRFSRMEHRRLARRFIVSAAGSWKVKRDQAAGKLVLDQPATIPRDWHTEEDTAYAAAHPQQSVITYARALAALISR
jgi:hypothetical protein